MIYLTRSMAAPCYTLQTDGWYRQMECKESPSYGYGLMIRRVRRTRKIHNCSADMTRTDRYLHKIEITFVPSHWDGFCNEPIDQSLGYFFGTNDEFFDFIDLVRNNCHRWVP